MSGDAMLQGIVNDHPIESKVRAIICDSQIREALRANNNRLLLLWYSEHGLQVPISISVAPVAAQRRRRADWYVQAAVWLQEQPCVESEQTVVPPISTIRSLPTAFSAAENFETKLSMPSVFCARATLSQLPAGAVS